MPNRYATDTQLGSWVSAQRRQYKIVTSGGNESAAMTPERAKKLRELGFEVRGRLLWIHESSVLIVISSSLLLSAVVNNKSSQCALGDTL